MAVLQLYFLNSKFTKELKSELYGFTEILCKYLQTMTYLMCFNFTAFELYLLKVEIVSFKIYPLLFSKYRWIA